MIITIVIMISTTALHTPPHRTHRPPLTQSTQWPPSAQLNYNLVSALNHIVLMAHCPRYGPVQSVKPLPCKDGDGAGSSPSASAVTVAFMDIKSACKALQTQHKLDERWVVVRAECSLYANEEASQLMNISFRLLKTDFYDPTSGDCGPGSGAVSVVCPPAPEEKGGGPGGGAAKLEGRSGQQHYYRGQERGQEYGGRQHPPSRYQEQDFRHRPRPQYRSNSSFNQERYGLGLPHPPLASGPALSCCLADA